MRETESRETRETCETGEMGLPPVARHPSGVLVVSDRGNRRLQFLQEDGTTKMVSLVR